MPVAIPLIVVALAGLAALGTSAGFLQSTQHIIKPMLQTLHAKLKWFGGLQNIVKAVENAIYNSLDVQLKGGQKSLRDFLIGVMQGHITHVTVTNNLARQALQALLRMNGITVPLKIRVATDPTNTGVWNLSQRLDALVAKAQDDARMLEQDVNAAKAYGDHTAVLHSDAALTAANKYTDTKLKAEITKLTETTIPKLITADLAVSGPIGKAIAAAISNSPYLTEKQVDGIITADLGKNGDITQAIHRAITDANAVTPAQVEAAITADLKPGGSIYREVQKLIPAAVAGPQGPPGVPGERGPAGPQGLPGVGAGGGVSADEVAAAIQAAIAGDLQPGAPIAQAIHDAIFGLVVTPPTTVPPPTGDLAAQVAALAGSLAVVTAIPFVKDANCRQKVSQICASDSNLWGDLLGALAVTEIAHDWKQLAGIVGTGATWASSLLADFK